MVAVQRAEEEKKNGFVARRFTENTITSDNI
jgi:hypothetical protein